MDRVRKRNIERYTAVALAPVGGGNANGRRRTQKVKRKTLAMGQGEGSGSAGAPRGDIYLLFYVEACHGLREHLSPLQPLSDRLKPVVAGIQTVRLQPTCVSTQERRGLRR